ncbi:MAG TPA: tRNA pseudouridine(38-40) synthase TruA [Candidatus Sulfotelmatobacter sp.]|nr:tRNA pseudouridine(38-40) synthase TruA [Candidatus Sulfotelmatobacter sp.]
MRTFKLVLEYQGTQYHGWQVQPGLATIQGTLQDALARIAGRPVPVVGAGRTDAGVHAVGQVASFRADLGLDPPTLQRALNASLPRDIAVVEAAEAPSGFDARRDATARTYRYTLLCRSYRSAVWRDMALHIPRPLALDAMSAAAGRLVGEHDFSAFRAAHCTAPTPFRRVTDARLDREGDLVHFLITADAFLQHMVRIIMGTLVQVGVGCLTPEGFQAILASGDRRRAGKTLDPRGLCLVRVHYPSVPCPR